jgi:hypothetical protein
MLEVCVYYFMNLNDASKTRHRMLFRMYEGRLESLWIGGSAPLLCSGRR